MAVISVLLIVLFGIILVTVILAVITRIILRINTADALDCYMDIFFDIFLQTLVLGDSLIASILITDDNFALVSNQSIKSRAHLIIIFSSVNIGLILFKFIFPSIPTKAKKREYDERVRQVRNAQVRLMEHHSKATRVGMRDVSRKRAKQIHKSKQKQQKQKQQKQQTQEIKQRVINVKEEKQLNQLKQNIELSIPNKRSDNTNNINNDAIPLPQEWKTYFNNDGVPYYYNQNTGETTWRHPAENADADAYQDPSIHSMNAPRPMEAKNQKLFRNKQINTVLIVPASTGKSLRYFHRFFPFIAGFADEIFDIVAAVSLLEGIIFSVNIKIFIIASTYAGVFIELIVLFGKIHGRFATNKRLQQGQCTCIQLLGFTVLVEFCGVLFECVIGLYLLFEVIGNDRNPALFYCSVTIYFIIGLVGLISLPFIFKGTCASHQAQEPIYRD